MKSSEYEQFVLDNGIRCVHRRAKSPVAHLALTIGAGTRDEAAGAHGVAHLVEHLLFKGTRRRSAYQVNGLLENAGGELNAFTTKEETVVHATLLSADFAKATDLLVDMAFHSTFPDKELEKERTVVIDEINACRDNPSEQIFDDFESLLFAGSTLGRTILGDKRALKKIKSNDLIDYTTVNYCAEQTVFSASSNLTHARFRTLCDRYLAAVETSRWENRRQAPALQPSFTQTKSRSIHQAHAVVGGYGYDLHHEGRIPLAFLVNLLGGPSAVSRLNLELRERRGWTYHVESSYVPYGDTGMVTTYLGCERERLDDSLAQVHMELRKLRDQRLTSAQLHRAKRQFIGQMTIAAESAESQMLGIAKSLLVYGSFDSTADIARKIEALTADQLLEAAREVFAEEKLSTLIYR